VAGVKLTGWSDALGRAFHVDAFVVGEAPTVVALLFGGSGVSAAEYECRSQTVIPVFDTALPGLARLGSFGLVYVTAPFDVPFARLPDDPTLARRWDAHVLSEVVPLVEREVRSLAGLPRYLVGFSGGALLALSGHHLDPVCVGAGLLGPDGLYPELSLQERWEPVPVIYNLNDGVIEQNRAAVIALGDAVELFHRLPGGHALADYVRNDSLRGLLWRAVRAAAQTHVR